MSKERIESIAYNAILYMFEGMVNTDGCTANEAYEEIMDYLCCTEMELIELGFSVDKEDE